MAATKNARIEVRLTQEMKEIFEAAAAYLGQSISEFVVATVRERASEVNEQKQLTVLSNRDRDRFFAALEAAQPSEALQASAEKYKQVVREGGPNVDDRIAGQAP